MQVEAIQSMEHNGPRRRGDRFLVSPGHAQQLAAKGLVRIVAVPPKAAGAPSSASPVVQASQQTTRKRSGAGERRKQDEQSSS